MAPEVMEQLHGYDFKADIWSFGITALELARGHDPFSKYPPMKVLLMTLQNAPPGLDYERDRKFSRSFKQMIAMCLVKDPSKRPSAQKLLKQPFFKQARSQDYITQRILEGLPTLGDCHQALKEKEEDMLAQKKIPDGKKEEMSQNEYKRGISCWNFDIRDLKSQASLTVREISRVKMKKDVQILCLSLTHFKKEYWKIFPLLQVARQRMMMIQTRSDISDSNFKVSGASSHDNVQNGVPNHGNERENGCSGSCGSEVDEKNVDVMLAKPSHERRFSTCSLTSELTAPHEWRFSMSSSSSDIFLSSKGGRFDQLLHEI